MGNFEDKLKKCKNKIIILHIFIICIIIFLGILLILADEITKFLIVVLGIIFIKFLWKKLEDLIEYYNYLIYENQDNKCNKTSTKIIPNKKYEKNIKDQYCQKCFGKINVQESFQYNGICEKCYKEKYGEEKHYCDVCQRLLTKEEYEDYSCYCEECYIDINAHYEHYGLDEYTNNFIDAIDSPEVWNDYYNKR